MSKTPFQEMTDSELVLALAATDPLTSNLSELLVQMWRRGLVEAEAYGRKLMAGNRDGNLYRHPDAALYDVLEVICGCFDAQLEVSDWIRFQGYEERIRDTLMIIATRRDPEFGFKVLVLAKKDGDDIDIVLDSILTTVPADNELLQPCLIYWAWQRNVSPRIRLAILHRLGQLPWSETLENFFVKCYLDDDGVDKAITSAIDEPLRTRR